MNTSTTVVAKKRRGPKPTGKGQQIVVRMQPDQLAHLDEWLSLQPEALSRPAAIRKIINEYLIGQGIVPWQEEPE